MRVDTDFLVNSFGKVNIELTNKQIGQFNDYYTMLIEKNKVMNLTGIVEYHEVVIKHFIDSILINDYFDFSKKSNIIDVGTGAGFPGIPLKIVYPNINITLLDSLNKRVKFLQEVIESIGLENVNCIHGRAEDFGHNSEYREKYDLCVSRAVANLSTLSEYCLPFVKQNGFFISYKSFNSDDEINQAEKAISKLASKLISSNTRLLPETEIYRKFICIKKISVLNKKYPRKAGLPSKEPL